MRIPINSKPKDEITNTELKIGDKIDHVIHLPMSDDIQSSTKPKESDEIKSQDQNSEAKIIDLATTSKREKDQEAEAQFKLGQSYEGRDLVEAVKCYKKALVSGHKKARARLDDSQLWNAIDYFNEIEKEKQLANTVKDKQETKSVAAKVKFEEIINNFKIPAWIKEYGIVYSPGKEYGEFSLKHQPSIIDFESDLLQREYRIVLLFITCHHYLGSRRELTIYPGYYLHDKLDDKSKTVMFGALINQIMKIKFGPEDSHTSERVFRFGLSEKRSLSKFMDENRSKVTEYLHRSSVSSLFPRASSIEKAQIRYAVGKLIENGAYWVADKSSYRFMLTGKSFIHSALSDPFSDESPKKLREAIEWFSEKHAKLYPKDVDIHRLRGDAYFYLNMDDKAKQCYDMVTKIDPKFQLEVKTVENFIHRGKINIINKFSYNIHEPLSEQTIQSALWPFEEALKLDAKSSEPHFGKALVQWLVAYRNKSSVRLTEKAKRDYEQVKTFIESGLANNSESTDGHFMMGNINIDLELDSEALPHFIRIQNAISPSSNSFSHVLLKKFYYLCLSPEKGILHCSKNLLTLAANQYATAAKDGDLSAQFKYGFCWETGFGIILSYTEAVKWYEKAALNKHPLAIFHLAKSYYDGRGVAKDKDKARQLFAEALPGVREAAEMNDNHALTALGFYHEEGWADVEKNAEKAFKFFYEAATKDHVPAQCQVGRCYRFGIGIPKDEKISLEWYQKAAIQGYPAAQSYLGWCYLEGKGLPKDVKMAAEWVKSAEDQGYPDAQRLLAYMHEYGIGVYQDVSQASRLYECAAKNGNTLAQTSIGLWYLNGKGVAKDEKAAAGWLQKAVDNDSTTALIHLGYCYEHGKGVAKDPIMAITLYKKAAALGQTEALARLASSELKPIAEYLRQEDIADKFLQDVKFSKEKGQGDSKHELKASRLTYPEDKDGKITVHASYQISYGELTLGGELGRGGYGIVYQGTWKTIPVAVKQLLSGTLTKETIQEFKAESTIMAQLRAPNVVQFYGYCDSPHYCLVMEYMPKGSLYGLLHSDKALDWSLRHSIANDIAIGLAFLHASNVLHRDLKSLNVLLDEHFRAKLSDFGLSRVKSETRTTTSKGGAVGTLAWMAPELIEGSSYTQKSDIYSLAMTLWELASRQLPFKDAASPMLIPIWVAQGKREKIPDDCPKKIASLIRVCWENDPVKRPTADEIVRYLKSDQEEFKSAGAALPSSASAVGGSSIILANLDSVTSASGRYVSS